MYLFSTFFFLSLNVSLRQLDTSAVYKNTKSAALGHPDGL